MNAASAALPDVTITMAAGGFVSLSLRNVAGRGTIKKLELRGSPNSVIIPN